MLSRLNRFAGVFIAGVVSLAFAQPAFAQDPTLTMRQDFLRNSFRAAPINPRTSRAIGMGNAFTAVGGSYDSMFYNPSGLASVPEWQFSIIGFRGETNSDTPGFVQDAVDLPGADAASINTFFQSRIGEIYYLSADNIAHLVLPYGKKWVFGFAYAYLYRLDGIVEDQGIAGPFTYITALRRVEDNAGFATVAYRVFDEYLDVGMSLKFISRVDVRTSDTPASVVANGDVSYNKDFFKPFKGPGDFSAGSDIGFTGRLPFKLLMQDDDEDASPWGIRNGYVATGFTFQDVARTRFKPQSPDVANGILVAGSADVPMTIDWGLGIAVPFEVGKLSFGLDVRDINRDEIKLSDKYSLGLELEFRLLLTLRGGVNANGFAAGGEIRAYALRLNGEFVQERNPAVLNNQKETRFAAGLSLGWPYK